MNKLLLAIGLILVITVSGCLSTTVKAEPQSPTWVTIEPIQCFQNLWEQNWLLKYDLSSSDYPIENENDIIKEFYELQGVKIYKIEKEQTGDVVCDACICARGDRINLLIETEDLALMLVQGYSLSGS